MSTEDLIWVVVADQSDSLAPSAGPIWRFIHGHKFVIRPCYALLCIVIVLTPRCSLNTIFVESIGTEIKRQL